MAVKQNVLTDLNLLSSDIKSFFNGGEFWDVTLRVKGRVFRAHKVILAARSPVFASYFKRETSESQAGIMDIPDCEPYPFSDFLEYLYSGKLENYSITNALHLYKISLKYNVQEVKIFCVKYMKCNLNTEFFCDIISLADLYNDENLYDAAQEYFNEHLSDIFETFKWKEFLKNNSILANKLLMEMALVVRKRPKLK